jgi:hypothetical protein
LWQLLNDKNQPRLKKMNQSYLKKIPVLLVALLVCCEIFGNNGLPNYSPVLHADTTVIPEPTGGADTEIKVGIAAGQNEIEFFPAGGEEGGALIKPVNKNTGQSVSTSFYAANPASWMFYSNGRKNFAVNAAGTVTSSVPLLINTTQADGSSALRVNGVARVDSSLIVQAAGDNLSYISLSRSVKSVYDGEDDSVSAYTTTPTAWAMAFANHLPVFRIRHPNNVSSGVGNTSTLRDFMILPYQYGFAIEFNGVVECWVGEWSIHRNDFYKDVEGKGDGWGAVLWVGNDQDIGGVRATARNNEHKGGNVVYGELSVERFNGTPDGDFRFRLPSTQNQFYFVYGERGSTNIVATLNNTGLIIPKVASVGSVTAPQKGQISFDSAAAAFKGYNGSQWVTLGTAGGSASLVTGSYTISSNGASLFYSIPHGLGVAPVYFTAVATSAAASGIRYITADNTNIYINYAAAPSAGINNLSWNWQARP